MMQHLLSSHSWLSEQIQRRWVHCRVFFVDCWQASDQHQTCTRAHVFVHQVYHQCASIDVEWLVCSSSKHIYDVLYILNWWYIIVILAELTRWRWREREREKNIIYNNVYNVIYFWNNAYVHIHIGFLLTASPNPFLIWRFPSSKACCLPSSTCAVRCCRLWMCTTAPWPGKWSVQQDAAGCQMVWWLQTSPNMVWCSLSPRLPSCR